MALAVSAVLQLTAKEYIAFEPTVTNLLAEMDKVAVKGKPLV